MPITSDGLISKELITEKINSDLANTFGNLINRTISMSYKYFDGFVQNRNQRELEDNNLIDEALKTSIKVEEAIDKLNISLAISTVIDLARTCNKYIDDTAPWILAKEHKYDRLNTVLYNILESIRIIAILLQPFLPDTSKKILDSLNTKEKSFNTLKEFGKLENNIKIEKLDILFNKIEK
jgi:methionyl-tRNA synthetase